jgi:hypothetical protein
MGSVHINKVIEDFCQLQIDDKEYAVEVIKKQLIEAKRDRIARRAKDAIANLKKGEVKRGTVSELFKDLESD